MKVLARAGALGAWILAAAVVHGTALGNTSARFAFMLDVTSDTVLLDRASDVPMEPASMSKLMTVYMVFEALKQGTLTMEDTLLVSREAAGKGGSKMFLRAGERVSVADLLRGVIVQSGNDACIVIAEGLAGTEADFATAMTKRARELGLRNSTFANSTGWPHPDHLMSARDLARLSAIMIETFPDLYPMFRERTFTYNGIRQGNRNTLLYDDPSADGLKTGFTQKSKFGLAATAIRGGRRIILVLNGLPSSRARRQEAARLMDWGFRTFPLRTLFEPGEKVVDADVWLGDRPKVSLVAAGGLKVALTAAAYSRMQVKVRMTDPVAAPIGRNDRLGTLVLTAPGVADREVPLVAGDDVGRLGAVERIGATLLYLLLGRS